MNRPNWLKVGAMVRHRDYTGTVLAVAEDPNGVTQVMWWVRRDGWDHDVDSFIATDDATVLEPMAMPEMVTGEVVGKVEVRSSTLWDSVPDLPRGTYHIVKEVRGDG